jgi:hypothetical protein
MTQRLRLTSIASSSNNAIDDHFANIVGDRKWSQNLVAMIHAMKDVNKVLPVHLDPSRALLQPHLRHAALTLPNGVRSSFLVHNSFVNRRRRLRSALPPVVLIGGHRRIANARKRVCKRIPRVWKIEYRVIELVGGRRISSGRAECAHNGWTCLRQSIPCELAQCMRARDHVASAVRLTTLHSSRRRGHSITRYPQEL